MRTFLNTPQDTLTKNGKFQWIYKIFSCKSNMSSFSSQELGRHHSTLATSEKLNRVKNQLFLDS